MQVKYTESPKLDGGGYGRFAISTASAKVSKAGFVNSTSCFQKSDLDMLKSTYYGTKTQRTGKYSSLRSQSNRCSQRSR